MTTISLTTIIISAVTVLLALLGALVGPFLRSLDFTDAEEASPEDTPQTEPLTVLITANDELPELERSLPLFLTQKYGAPYQVIVVCQSTDRETQDYLKRMTAEYPHLYFTFIPESSRYMSRKKLQITLGVKAALHEWIIVTEPTCQPTDDQWLAAMSRQCREPNHLVLAFVGLDEETRGVRRFEQIRKAYYLLRRAQHSYGYRSHMANIAFRKSDFLREQGYQGNLELVRGEYDFLVNKYAACGTTAVELSPAARLTEMEPTDKEWHNRRLYLYASLPTLSRSGSMRLLMFFDHLLPHLSLLVSLGVLAIGILQQDWILTAAAALGLMLLLVVRTLMARRAVSRFDEELGTLMLPLYELGIIWRNLAGRLRYLRADKTDFTSHKL